MFLPNSTNVLKQSNNKVSRLTTTKDSHAHVPSLLSPLALLSPSSLPSLTPSLLSFYPNKFVKYRLYIARNCATKASRWKISLLPLAILTS